LWCSGFVVRRLTCFLVGHLVTLLSYRFTLWVAILLKIVLSTVLAEVQQLGGSFAVHPCVQRLCGYNFAVQRLWRALWYTPSQYSGFVGTSWYAFAIQRLVGTPFSTAALRELCCTPFLSTPPCLERRPPPPCSLEKGCFRCQHWAQLQSTPPCLVRRCPPPPRGLEKGRFMCQHWAQRLQKARDVRAGMGSVLARFTRALPPGPLDGPQKCTENHDKISVLPGAALSPPGPPRWPLLGPLGARVPPRMAPPRRPGMHSRCGAVVLAQLSQCCQVRSSHLQISSLTNVSWLY